jgi:hypothetical protein
LREMRSDRGEEWVVEVIVGTMGEDQHRGFQTEPGRRLHFCRDGHLL